MNKLNTSQAMPYLPSVTPPANIILSMPKLFLAECTCEILLVLTNSSCCDILNGAPTTKRKGTQKGSHDMSTTLVPLPRRTPTESTGQLNAQILWIVLTSNCKRHKIRKCWWWLMRAKFILRTKDGFDMLSCKASGPGEELPAFFHTPYLGGGRTAPSRTDPL